MKVIDALTPLLIAAAISFPLFLAASAWAQAPQPATAQSPTEQALSQKLIEEINSNLSLRAQNVQLQEQLAKLQAEKKAAAAEPPKPEPKK